MKTLKVLAAASVLMLPIATPAFASGEPAQVIKGVGCVLNFGVFGLPGGAVTDQSIDVSNSGGNTQLTCHFDVLPNFTPDKAMNAQGFACGVIEQGNFAVTTDSRATITPGGKARLSCQIKKP